MCKFFSILLGDGDSGDNAAEQPYDTDGDGIPDIYDPNPYVQDSNQNDESPL